MALSIKDPEAEALIRRLAEKRKTTMTNAIRVAVAAALDDDAAERAAEIERKRKALKEIQARAAALPDLMTAAEVDAWMYDENGLPH